MDTNFHYLFYQNTSRKSQKVLNQNIVTLHRKKDTGNSLITKKNKKKRKRKRKKKKKRNDWF